VNRQQNGENENAMRRVILPICILIAASFATIARAQESVPVTVDNFTRAESDLYIGSTLKDAGGVGKLIHHREPVQIDHQNVIRLNRDTLYSAAVFDLDAGPVTITLPDAGDRLMSMQIIDEDQYTPQLIYTPGPHTLSKDTIDTRYVLAAVRTLVDPNDPKDVAAVHALQDAIQIDQPGGLGTFEVPNWDLESQKRVREALLVLAATLPSTAHAFGAKGEVDPVRRLIGAASAWGGNPDNDATYLNIVPAKNDGKTVYKLNVKDVPVDGFWSISVYNAQGYHEKNEYNAYNLNSVTAKKGEDGSVNVRFGGCDGQIPNCLPVTKGWNYMVRLYRPHAEVLDGSWKMPEAQPAS